MSAAAATTGDVAGPWAPDEEWTTGEDLVFGPGQLIRFEAFVEGLTLLDGAPFVLDRWQRDFMRREFNAEAAVERGRVAA